MVVGGGKSNKLAVLPLSAVCESERCEVNNKAGS